MYSKRLSFLVLLCLGFLQTYAQTDSTAQADTLSKFDAFNKKAEAFFKVAPVPLISYSTDAGNVFGLAKFNAFQLSKRDTVSKPSKLSEVFTISTKGRINASVSNDLIFKENKYMILSYFNYKKQPEYLLGIGNDVSRDDKEQVVVDRIKFSSTALIRVKNFFYAGVSIDVADYFSIETDSNSFLIEDNVTGRTGGVDVGVGLSFGLDSRDNRYNASSGNFFLSTLMFYPEGLGSSFPFTKFDFDVRKYFKPWKNLKHVIAIQATTSYTQGDVPFYDLSQLGGEDKMRGYYKGALRDRTLIDSQVEYRMHVWNIFGVVGWIGTGRVGEDYTDMALDGFRMSYGAGFRLQVDSKNEINLRVDMGFGPDGVKGFYLNFSEAF